MLLVINADFPDGPHILIETLRCIDGTGRLAYGNPINWFRLGAAYALAREILQLQFPIGFAFLPK